MAEYLTAVNLDFTSWQPWLKDLESVFLYQPSVYLRGPRDCSAVDSWILSWNAYKSKRI